MAGPWEAYQTPAQAPAGPWTAYQQPDRQEPQTEQPSAFGRAARFVDNLVRQTARGITFGFADEIAAGLNTGGGLWGDYQAALAAERARDREFEAEHPIAATGANIVGGIMVPAGAAVRGATLPGAMVRGGVTGATQGAVAGFGEGEGGLEPRLESAQRGALIGGGVGAAAPAVIAGVTGATRAIGRATGLAADSNAERMILRDLARDSVTPEELAARAREAGDAPAMITDLAGENVAQSAQVVARTPGPGRDIAARELSARGGANQAERLTRQVRDLVSDDDFAQGVEAVARRRAMQAAPNYERAYAVTLPRDLRLQRFLNDPDVRAGVRAGIDSARREALANDQAFDLAALGVRLGRNGDVQLVGGGTPTRLFDAAKRGLDEMIEASRGEGGRATSRTRELTQLREAMLREVDRLNPAFAEARRAYADQSALISAAQDGRRLLSLRPEEFERGARDIAQMSPPEREFFRLGVARALLDRIEGATDAQDLTRLNRIFGTPAIRQRLRAAFDSEDDYRRFAGAMLREVNMARTNATIAPRGGSPTMPMQERAADLRNPPRGPIASAVVDPGPTPQPNLLAALAGQGESISSAPNVLLRRFLQGRNEAAYQRDAAAMAPYLFTTDPAARQRLADALVARQLTDEARRRAVAPVARGASRGAVTGTVLGVE